MARIFSFPWALRALLLALCARVSLACTLYTPSTSQGITDEVQFQTSWTACTPPVTIQFWDKDTNTLLTSYSGSASTVYFTIHNGAGVTVYFVLIDSAGLKATSISYVVKPNLSLSSTSSPTFPPSTRVISTSDIALLSLQSVSILSVNSVASVSSESVNSQTTTPETTSPDSTTTPTTSSSPTYTNPFPSNTGSSPTSSSSAPGRSTSQSVPTRSIPPGSSTSTSSSSSSTTTSSGGGSSHVGLIAGASAGGAVALVIVGSLIAFLIRKKNQDNLEDYMDQQGDPAPILRVPPGTGGNVGGGNGGSVGTPGLYAAPLDPYAPVTTGAYNPQAYRPTSGGSAEGWNAAGIGAAGVAGGYGSGFPQHQPADAGAAIGVAFLNDNTSPTGTTFPRHSQPPTIASSPPPSIPLNPEERLNAAVGSGQPRHGAGGAGVGVSDQPAGYEGQGQVRPGPVDHTAQGSYSGLPEV